MHRGGETAAEACGTYFAPISGTYFGGDDLRLKEARPIAADVEGDPGSRLIESVPAGKNES